MGTTMSRDRKVWSQQGACTKYPDLFNGGDVDFRNKTIVRIAKSVCNSCPVRDLCLKWAISNEVEGLYGGTSTTERKNLRKDPIEVLLAEGECPPEPELETYLKPAKVQAPGAYKTIQKPSRVTPGKGAPKRTSRPEPQSLMARLDQLLLELPAFS